MSHTARRMERRSKQRFILEREVRYRVLEEDRIVEIGTGTTLNISSGGVAFIADHDIGSGAFVEVSISWPALLDNSCRMRLVAFGRVLRSMENRIAVTIEKYEFRTQGRAPADGLLNTRGEMLLRRWADGRKEDLRLMPAVKPAFGVGHA